MDTDKLAAYQTLYKCLLTVAELMAPVSPFFGDRLYRDLKRCDRSVHLELFPVADMTMIDKDLEERMHLAQTVTSMVLALRRKAEIKVGQDLEIVGDDDQSILVKKVKPDFKKLGPKFGKQMKQVAAAIQGLDQHEISRLEREGASP